MIVYPGKVEIEYQRFPKRLTIPVGISKHQGKEDEHEYIAIWNTSSHCSYVSSRVIKRTRFDSLNEKGQYMLNLNINNQVFVTGFWVNICELPPDIDFLIGLDVINHGDFSLIDQKDKVMLTFKVDWKKNIDQDDELLL